MKASWCEIGFQLETTQDESPTLRWIQSTNTNSKESMHHSGGAYSETEFIYTPQIHTTASTLKNPHFFILGLGLGYIELIIARECIANNLPPDNVKISSFEIHKDLRSLFWLWLDSKNQTEITNQDLSVFFLVYDAILNRISPSQDLASKIKLFLFQNLKTQDGLLGEFNTAQVQKLGSVDCYLYDAFSSKTNSELWNEEFLFHFLNSTRSANSVFSTYACTGNLKRALKRAGFTVVIQQGFQGKRDFTSAFICSNKD